MLVVNSECQTIELYRLRKCDKSELGEYQLILQDTADKELLIFDVTDLNEGKTPRYKFEICFNNVCAHDTTYNYFLVSNEGWETQDIDINFPIDSYYKANKTALSQGCLYLVSHNILLVSNKTKAKLIGNNGLLTDFKIPLIANSETGDNSPDGMIVRYLDVLNNGLLKYMPVPAFTSCSDSDYTCDNKKIIEYDGKN